jgi:hypothetical protein
MSTEDANPMHLWYCRGPCKPDLYCWLFHLPDLDTDLDCGFFVYLTGHSDYDCGLFCFPDLETPILTTDFCNWNEAHGGHNRSTGDAYSFQAPDPTSGLFRGPCLSNIPD